jgi:hypothetical protein
MSYQTMDHAVWLERQNVALNRNHAGRRGWKPLPEKLSEFQSKVIDIVGMVGGGIYNANICSPEKIDWDYGNGVSLTWNQELATWDFDQLSRLVFLCHAARIRCSLSAVAPRKIRMCFWQRKATGDMAVRHPNLDEAVTAFKQYLPADHRILYREPEVLKIREEGAEGETP